MSSFVGVPIVLITLALVLYSVATWRNWRLRLLTTTQLVMLWIAVSADALATRMMGSYTETTDWSLHVISGYGALALMATLTIIGTWAKRTGRDAVLGNFHRYLVPVWILWIASYAAGVWVGIQRV